MEMFSNEFDDDGDDDKIDDVETKEFWIKCSWFDDPLFETLSFQGEICIAGKSVVWWNTEYHFLM